jgi:hypothetical protein
MRLIYIDESGDHGADSSNGDYPLFVLVACSFESSDYVRHFLPSMIEFKLRYWGHELAVLHEREIRRPQGDFSFLLNASKRVAFLEELSELVRLSHAHVNAVAWDKRDPSRRFSYGACLSHLLEELTFGQAGGPPPPVILESRGRHEDDRTVKALSDLSLEKFGAIRFVDKKANVAGLQLADLCARPIGMRILRPDSTNRAYAECVRPLMHISRNGVRADERIKLI